MAHTGRAEVEQNQRAARDPLVAWADIAVNERREGARLRDLHDHPLEIIGGVTDSQPDGAQPFVKAAGERRRVDDRLAPERPESKPHPAILLEPSDARRLHATERLGEREESRFRRRLIESEQRVGQALA
ncbi:MAG: hypothetical protein ACRDSN_22590, partial [Pseudonocardiaceae bacterium]